MWVSFRNDRTRKVTRTHRNLPEYRPSSRRKETHPESFLGVETQLKATGPNCKRTAGVRHGLLGRRYLRLIAWCIFLQDGNQVAAGCRNADFSA
jgi:hypothetical protein